MDTHDRSGKNLGDQIKDAGKDVRDTAREHIHRSEADAERAKRDVAGDTMTPGEKMASGANELKERTQAEIDKGKRNLRDAT